MRKTSRSSKKLGAVPKVIFSGNKELCNEISRSGIKYGRFKTTSGKYTNFYVDIKGLFSMPTFLNAVTKEIVDLVKYDFNYNYIAGMELGAIPIISTVSYETFIPMLMIRKEQKKYGTKSQIEGYHDGGKVLVLEDVVNTGGSVIKTIDVLKKHGLQVITVICVVCRSDSVNFDEFNKRNIELVPLVTISGTKK